MDVVYCCLLDESEGLLMKQGMHPEYKDCLLYTSDAADE